MTTDASLSLAIQNLRRQWEENPTHPIVFQLAEEYRRIERFDLAAEVLQQQVDSYPRHFSARVALGRCHLEMGEPRSAAKVLEPVVAEDPTHLIANKLLAKAYLEMGEATKARDRLDLYVLLNDDDWEIDDLERRLRDLDNQQPLSRPEVLVEDSASGGLSIEQIEQEVMGQTVPPLSDEVTGDRDFDDSYAGDGVESAAEEIAPIEIETISEAVEVAASTVAPQDAPLEDYSASTPEESFDYASEVAPDRIPEVTPSVVLDPVSEALPEIPAEPTSEELPQSGFGAAAKLTVESSPQDAPADAAIWLAPQRAENRDEPFHVETRTLQSNTWKRQLASGGIFDLDSPGQVFAGPEEGAPADRSAPQQLAENDNSTSQPEETVTLGNLYMQQGHGTEARRIFNQVLHREPANLQARLGIAKLESIDRKTLSARDLLRAGSEPATTELTDSTTAELESLPSKQKIRVLNRYLGYFKRAQGEPGK